MRPAMDWHRVHNPAGVALADGDDFTTLSEHDTPEGAVAARREMERVCNDAVAQLGTIAA